MQNPNPDPVFRPLLAVLLLACWTDPARASWRYLDGRWVNDQDLILSHGLAPMAHIQEQWMEQRLDHFDPTNTRTWQQKYFANLGDNHDAPIFLQIGGEAKANSFWITGGQVAKNVAPRYKAHQFLLEHRYYGDSHPTKDLSTENLDYLTIEQALQDIAMFVQYVKEKHNLHGSKWIVMGGSYAGSLAAWFRLKYPHLAVGAVASSAPVQAILDFQDYLKVVTDDMGPECAQTVKDATEEMAILMKTEHGRKMVHDTMNLCMEIDATNKLDHWTLMLNIMTRFMVAAQYDNQNGHLIRRQCSIMVDTKSHKTPFQRLARTVSGATCFEFRYTEYIKDLLQTNYTEMESAGARQWIYQMCTEFSFFQSTNYPKQPFGDSVPLEYFYQICKDLFPGKKIDRQSIANAVDATNRMYGGFNLTVTNVIFPNGNFDPWHALGILWDIGPTAKAVMIQGGSHCSDMYPDLADDSQSLKSARKAIMMAIDRFLAAP